MAEDKHNFIVYTDWKKYIDNLSNEQAGIWIKWAVDYCSDLDPDLPQDQAVQMLIILSKDTFKKDLAKYYARKDRMDKINETKRQRKQEETITERNRSEIVSDKCNMLNDKCNMLYEDSKLSNNTHVEEKQIDNLKNFLSELEQLLGYAITGKKGDIACKLYEEYGYKTAMYEIRKNIDKQSPIAYTYTALTNNRPKNENTTSGSEWWDKTKRELEEKDKGSEWLENFKKQMEDKQ